MPIYEYECPVCRLRFERKQGFDEKPVSICPRCNGKARRVLHSVPIFFKGSGFYITDNRKEHPSVEQERKDEGTTPEGK